LKLHKKAKALPEMAGLFFAEALSFTFLFEKEK